jgi:DNA-directed RNA polymerase subunit D
MPTIINTPEKLVLRLNISEPLANSIRRSVNEIPTLAIDEVEIFKNDSALYDEVLALRLGLLPLKTEKSMSDKTKIEFKLIKKGPCTVYASDLSGSGDVIYPEMPLTIIKENHSLELAATARLGTGLEHSKHVPGLCYYRHLLEGKSTKEIDKIVQKSKSDFKPEKSGQKWICDLEDGEINEIKNIDKDSISDIPELIFIIESYGNIPAKDILSGAIKALSSNLKEFEKALK